MLTKWLIEGLKEMEEQIVDLSNSMVTNINNK